MAATPRSARFAYDVVRDALKEQLARIDSLDQKAGIILAAGGIVGGLVLSPDDRLSAFPTWLAILIVVTLVASLLGALISLANRRYELAPTPERVASLAGADEDRLRWLFIGNLLEAVELNRAKLQIKSRWLTASQFALFATVFQLGAYSVWHEVKGSAHMQQVQAAGEKERIRIPRPVEGGSYDVESLGPIVDRLMGDRRLRERAAETIHILTAEVEPSEEPTEEDPVEVPPPVPGGSEPITRGDDPPAEKR